MLHTWPYQEDTLTADGYVVLPAQSASEPPPARALRVRRWCDRGHAFTVANTILTTTGRRCIACLQRQAKLPRQAGKVVATGKRWHELPRRTEEVA